MQPSHPLQGNLVSHFSSSLYPHQKKKKKKEKRKEKNFWEIVVRKSFRKKSFSLEIFLYKSMYLTVVSECEF